MVRYNIDEVTDDMVLGESITLPTGKLLLSAGYQISQRYRERLRELGYQTLMIEQAGTEDVTPETIISPRTQAEITKNLNESGEQLTRPWAGSLRLDTSVRVADLSAAQHLRFRGSGGER